FAEEDALLAKADRLDIAVAVEDGKRVAVQQNPRAVVGERRRGADVELLPDLNNVLALDGLCFLRKHSEKPPCGLGDQGQVAGVHAAPPVLRKYSSINAQVVVAHPARAEAVLEFRAADFSLYQRDAPGRPGGFLDVIHNETRQTVLDDFGDRTAPESNHRRAAGERFDHYQTEGLRPVYRKE